jgi:hypothetical protein
MVEPLGDVLISELPEGFADAFGLLIAPGLAWPVVVPGAFPAGAMPPADEPAAVPEAPALPPAPAACANPIEPARANALTNAIVANFMGRSLVVEPG